MLIDLGTKLQLLADRELSASGMTTRQWFLCLVLEQAGKSLTLNEAAQRMGTSRQNAKQLALKLERKGFVLIEPDDSDGRALRLSLTAESAAFWAERTAEDRRFLARLFASFGDDETRALHASLKKLVFDTHRRLSDGSFAFSEDER